MYTVDAMDTLYQVIPIGDLRTVHICSPSNT